jgi:hypothetical protein
MNEVSAKVTIGQDGGVKSAVLSPYIAFLNYP